MSSPRSGSFLLRLSITKNKTVKGDAFMDSLDGFGYTYVFSDIFCSHSLVGSVCGVEGPQDEPASSKQRIRHDWSYETQHQDQKSQGDAA